MYVTSAENRSCRTPVTYHLTKMACYWIRQRLVNMVNRVFDWRSKVLSGILLKKGCSYDNVQNYHTSSLNSGDVTWRTLSLSSQLALQLWELLFWGWTRGDYTYLNVLSLSFSVLWAKKFYWLTSTNVQIHSWSSNDAIVYWKVVKVVASLWGA